jgi:hypothetical protein
MGVPRAVKNNHKTSDRPGRRQPPTHLISDAVLHALALRRLEGRPPHQQLVREHAHLRRKQNRNGKRNCELSPRARL